MNMRKFLLLIALFCPLWLLAQQESDYRTIKGVVMDSITNETLIGATVVIDPSAPESKNLGPKGTITDIDGKFELKVPKAVNYVVISFIGYKPLKLDISKKTDFKVLLQPDQEQLEEVVVTGYQQIEKRKATSAIQTVKMDDIKRIGVASIDQLLEGQVAGMTSIPTNGAPGAPNKMRIRSTVSLTGSTDPLWVLDGMILEGNDIPANFSDKDNIDNLYNTSIAGVNPADIEDITILKDAAATAIYGARAANGVIVVTTKKGKAGKMRVNASAAMFVTTKPDLGKLNFMNSSEKVDFELNMASLDYVDAARSKKGEVYRILEKHDQWDTYRSGGFSSISQEAQNEINALRNKTVDWGDQIYQSAVNQQYNLSLSGGSEKARYFASAGYYNEQGTTKKTGFERFNGTLKTSFDLRDNLQLDLSMFLTHSTRKSYITDLGGFTNPANYSRMVNPYLEVKDENGMYVYDPDIESSTGERYVPFNMVEERENTDYSLKNLAVKPMISLEYKPFTWLKFSTLLGMQIENSETEKFADKDTYYARKYRENAWSYSAGYWFPEGGIIQNWTDNMSQYQWRLQGEFHNVFADKHSVDVMVGYEMRGNKSTQVHTKGFGYDSKALTTKPLDFPNGFNDVSSSLYQQYKRTESENRYLSYYMTASYSYDNRYTVFGSMRFDGSNLFGVSDKYKYLPLWALSAAWNIDREDFLRNEEWLSSLKLRVSYGLQGNVDKNTSPYIVGTWGETSDLGDSSEPTITVTSPPNQKLRWEKTSNWNLGVDMGVLNNRITFSIDGYYRKSKDLIGVRSLPLENGFDYTSMNWAQVSNKGFEFSISTVNIRTKDFRWMMDFNIAHNKSNVDQITVRENERKPSLQGYSVGALFKLNTAGLDENGLQMFWRNGEKVSLKDFFGLDISGYFPTSTLTDKEFRELYTYAGTTEPKFTGGFINRFYYKNFDLTISTSFIIDQTMQETPFYSPSEMSPGSNYSKRVANIWSSSNPNGIYPRIMNTSDFQDMEYDSMFLWMGDSESGFKNYDYWFKNMSYLRVNSIRLGYTLPENVIKKLRLGSARISAEARNPFVIASSYKGYFDPETWGNVYTQPLPKTFSLGLDLTF